MPWTTIAGIALQATGAFIIALAAFGTMPRHQAGSRVKMTSGLIAIRMCAIGLDCVVTRPGFSAPHLGRAVLQICAAVVTR